MMKRHPARLHRALATALLAGSLVVVTAATAPPAQAFGSTASSSAPFTITGATSVGPGSPYPSGVTVSGLTGTVTSVSVTLTGLRHTFPDDVDMLLVGPTGANLVLLSDVGGGTDLVGTDLTIADGSPALPDSTVVAPGTYGPTNVGLGDTFAAPAPVASANTTLATAFGGSDPNGAWQLYVVDDLSDDFGSLAGWGLTIGTSGSPATSFSTATPTSVPSGGGTTPYPGTVPVAGVLGTVTGLSVTLSDITHPVSGELDVMLVGPTGASVMLMSDIGSGALSGTSLTFDDNGPAMVVGTTPATGTHHPTNNGTNDSFPFPAPPAAASTSLLTTFAGTDPNGDWKLYVVDDNAVANNGSVAGGWSLSLLTKLAQAIQVTAPPPSGAVGDVVDLAPVGGASGLPVELVVNAGTTNNACSTVGGTVHLDHVGTCLVDLSQAGNDDYTAAPTQQLSVQVGKGSQAVSFTSSPPLPARIGTTYDVTSTAGGASGNAPSLALDPVSTAGACSLAGSQVTFAAEGTCVLLLDQAGNDDYLAAPQASQSITVVRSSPSISAQLTSARPRSAAGWYRTPVTVTFTCDGDGVALTAPCPAPAVVSTSGPAQQVARTITTTDGGTATVSVTIRLDRVKPQVSITGIKKGRTYTKVPRVRCVGRDPLSGIASCRATVRKQGRKLVFAAVAVDRAGNASTVRGTAFLKPRKR